MGEEEATMRERLVEGRQEKGRAMIRQVGTLAQLLAAERRLKKARRALLPFSEIKAEDGDDFSAYPDDVVVRCEVTVGEIKRAKKAMLATLRSPKI
jgi:hypothetical protein